MLLEGLLTRGSLPVLEQVMAFTQARHEVLSNNISNFDTVNYKMQDLPAEEFFNALRRAVRRRDRTGGASLEMRPTRHFNWDQTGKLNTKHMLLKNNNILFHDGNNRFVEKQMSEMAQNALLHNVSVEMLRQQYSLLGSAISGRL